jgi:hypothetical protein
VLFGRLGLALAVVRPGLGLARGLAVRPGADWLLLVVSPDSAVVHTVPVADDALPAH